MLLPLFLSVSAQWGPSAAGVLINWQQVQGEDMPRLFVTVRHPHRKLGWAVPGRLTPSLSRAFQPLSFSQPPLLLSLPLAVLCAPRHCGGPCAVILAQAALTKCLRPGPGTANTDFSPCWRKAQTQAPAGWVSGLFPGSETAVVSLGPRQEMGQRNPLGSLLQGH